LNDYINDPKYIEIIAEREKFHDEIPGLAYWFIKFFLIASISLSVRPSVIFA
jgi:hypothetical protein